MISEAFDVDGKTVDVTKLTSKELAEKLDVGELLIPLGDHLYDSGTAEIEIFDFDEHFKLLRPLHAEATNEQETKDESCE